MLCYEWKILWIHRKWQISFIGNEQLYLYMTIIIVSILYLNYYELNLIFILNKIFHYHSFFILINYISILHFNMILNIKSILILFIVSFCLSLFWPPFANVLLRISFIIHYSLFIMIILVSMLFHLLFALCDIMIL